MRHTYLTHLTSLGLLLAAGPVAAQALTNNGATLTVTPGATLYVGGDYQQTTGSTLKTDGTMQVTGNVQSATGGTLDLGTGELEAKGHVTNAGTTQTGTTGTLRLTGTTNQNVDLAGGNVGNLIVNKSTASNDTVRIVTDLNVTNQLQMTDGMVRTRANTSVILPNAATVTGEAAGQYVQGNLVVTRTGVSGGSPIDFQNGVTINPVGNNLGNVSVKRSAGLKVLDLTFGQNPTNATYKSIDRIWAITPQNQPVTPTQLTMTWLPDDDNGLTVADFANAAAWKRTTSGAPWIPQSTYANAASRSMTVAASSFSDWTVATQNAPLPVVLLSFDAQRAGDAAKLTWVTASEKDNSHFEVQVSLNGRDFRTIGRVDGQGTSTQRHSYEFFDQKLLTYRADPVYYRLRQVDKDGTAALSQIRDVRVLLKGEFSATAWPNPFDGTSGVQVQVRVSAEAPVELTLVDAVGRTISQRTVQVEAGTTALPLTEANSLATGVYILKVRQGTEQTTIRLTHQ